ncbi:MAG: response regulator [Anaerolineae bacterium]|nr:response regulator [Anaerolineae bacterium]
MTNPRVLVVDDDPDMIRLVREVLMLIPCEALVATEVNEALETLRRETQTGQGIDAVLLDVRIPEGEEGFRILETMKANAVLQNIPVIMVTGVGDIKAKARGLRIGADDYVTKPFDPVELRARIGVVLRIRRTEQMLRRRNDELAALNEINRMVSSSLDLDRVLNSALEGLENLMEHAQALAIVINEEDTSSWSVNTARVPKGIWLEGRVIPQDDPALQITLDEERSSLQTAVVDGFWVDALKTFPLDILSIPLSTRDGILGMLMVFGDPETLSEQNFPLLEHVGSSVAVAVENARLFQEIESFAEELERSQTQLIQAEKMAAVGRLAASLAHEINNPLQAIQNSLHLALHTKLEDERRRSFLEMAQQEVARLVQIVRRMLDFYRPSSVMKELNLNESLENALAIAGKRLQQSHIEVVARTTPELPAVKGSANQLIQVFLNIIINAIEAMPDGGTLWVGTAYHSDRDQIVAAIRDSGPGIAPEVREHLFEPFHTTKTTGTGLGLTISYGIIERHQGIIEIESPPGSGTTFIVRLPRYHKSEN